MGDRANVPQPVTRARVARISTLVAINLVLWLLFSSRHEAAWPHRYGDAGTIDFIQYWTAHALMVQGGNPYDPASMLEAQRALGMSGPIAIVMWNPPWLVTLLDPILRFPFFTAASIWFGLGVLFAAATGALTTIAYRGRLVLSTATMIATFAFQPIASSLWFGQLGLLHALSVAGFLCAVSRARPILAGLMLVPLSVKPHLTYLVWVLLAYWVVRQRAWRIPLAFGAGLGALVAATWLLYPNSFAQWIGSAEKRPPFEWVVASLVGVVRELIYVRTGEAARWPLVVIPGATALALAAWLIARRPAIDLRAWLPPILALSVFTSPYGWVFDQCQLVVLQVALVALSDRRDVAPAMRRRVWLALAVVQLTILAVHTAGLRDMQHFFWTGLALACVWLYGARALDIQRLLDSPGVSLSGGFVNLQR